jgi:hypothetical protein
VFSAIVISCLDAGFSQLLLYFLFIIRACNEMHSPFLVMAETASSKHRGRRVCLWSLVAIRVYCKNTNS